MGNRMASATNECRRARVGRMTQGRRKTWREGRGVENRKEKEMDR